MKGYYTGGPTPEGVPPVPACFRISASNEDPEHFYRCHTKVTIANDKATVVWTIPDRLLRNPTIHAAILDELMEEFREQEFSSLNRRKTGIAIP